MATELFGCHSSFTSQHRRFRQADHVWLSLYVAAAVFSESNFRPVGLKAIGSVIPATAYGTHPWRLRTANMDCPTLSISHAVPTFPNQQINVWFVTANPSAEINFDQGIRVRCAVLTTKHAHMPRVNRHYRTQRQPWRYYYENLTRCECLHLRLHALSVPPRSANPMKTRTLDRYKGHQANDASNASGWR